MFIDFDTTTQLWYYARNWFNGLGNTLQVLRTKTMIINVSTYSEVEECQVYLVWAHIRKLKRFGQPHAVETFVNDISKYTDSRMSFYLWVSSVFDVITNSEVEEIWTATCCGSIHEWMDILLLEKLCFEKYYWIQAIFINNFQM